MVENIEPLLQEVSDLGEKLDNAKVQLQEIQSKISDITLSMPNIPHPSVPKGNSEDENEEVSKLATKEGPINLILSLKIMLI